MSEITQFVVFNTVQECSIICDSEFIGYGLVCCVFSPRHLQYFPIAFIFQSMYAFCYGFVNLRVHVSHPYVAVGNMHYSYYS